MLKHGESSSRNGIISVWVVRSRTLRTLFTAREVIFDEVGAAVRADVIIVGCSRGKLAGGVEKCQQVFKRVHDLLLRSEMVVRMERFVRSHLFFSSKSIVTQIRKKPRSSPFPLKDHV